MKSIKPLNFELSNLWATTRGIDHQKLLIATCFVLLISFSSLYLLFPPDLASQPWDSLQYGYSTEVDGIRSIRGNHPLGHVILIAVFAFAKLLGYDGRALTIFQATNGILGGLIVTIFFVILVSIIKIRALYAIGFSLIVGSSNGFRFFAGAGDIYHLSILFSLLVWASLAFVITLKNQPFPVLPGILTGLSILFHQLNSVLIPVGLVLILLTPASGAQAKKTKIKQIVVFIGAASAVVVLGFLVLGFIATSSVSLPRVIGWMQGYFGDPTYGRYLNREVFKTAWKTISQAVLFAPQNKTEYLSRGILTALALIIFPGLWFRKSLDGGKRTIMAASALQCLISWPLILWWEPQNPKFWLLTLIPWMIVLALCFEAVETSLRSWLPKFGTGLSRSFILLPLIMGTVILSINAPYTSGKEDPVAFNEALDVWMNNSGPNDVLITAGDLIPHLRFWGKRPNTVYLYRSLQASQASPDDFDKLRTDIRQALCAHHTVLITPAADKYILDSELSLVGVSREEVRSFLDEYAHQGEIVFWYRNVFDGKLLPVYALRRSVACSDRKSALDLR